MSTETIIDTETETMLEGFSVGIAEGSAILEEGTGRIEGARI